MTRWLKRLIPCLRNKQLNTSLSENEKLGNKSKINDETDMVKEFNEINELDINEKDSEIELFNEILEQQDENSVTIDKLADKTETGVSEININSERTPTETVISCTLHESLNDFCHAKVTHTNVKSRSPVRNVRDKPRNTLVFKTVMVNGEPCTTRYKTVEPELQTEKGPDELNCKLGEEIKGSEIKLVFSHDVLEYLTKSFLHCKDNDLNRNETGVNDLVVCTLFPKQNRATDDTDMDVDVANADCETNGTDNVNSETSDTMDVDEVNSNCTETSIPTMQSENCIFNKNQSSAQRSEYNLSSTNSVKGFQTSMSKSSPHMQQQETNISSNNRELPRLRRNVSKKVSWKENVEVCFFNHSSKSANEILQEVQPLIDHEVYWKECVCEMDRKRREKWLKIRADEQRCLTGDGQFHDYFAYRTHHFDDDELRLIE